MTEELMREAKTLHESGQLEAAEKVYLQILDAEPRNAAAQCSLGFVHMLQKRYADAEQHLSAAVAVEPRLTEA